MKKNASSAGIPSKEPYEPVHLGKRSRKPVAKVDCIPWKGGRINIELVCDEFTSLCPVTGQPDFGTILIRYVPYCWIVETKSLKLYLWRFRDRGVFNEELVAEIAEDLICQLEAEVVEVEGQFHSRGGIAIRATARRERIDYSNDDPLPF